MAHDAIAALTAAIARAVPDGPLGVAVSGGSDSTALLIAARALEGRTVHAFTVDHGLRPEAPAEAARVAALAARLGCMHRTLTLSIAPGAGLQARARAARYAALGRGAREAGVDDVLLGHTQDDVAETLVLRMRRGAGIDGLARMAARREMEGVTWHRPALGLTRAALRDALTARGEDWIDDPSNADPTFDRVEVRRAIAALGLDRATLAGSASALDEARASLVTHARAIARYHVREDRGDLLIDGMDTLRAAHASDPDPLPRLLLAGLHWIGGGYGPRRDARLRLLDHALGGTTCTLGGCVLTHARDTLRLSREPAAAAPPGPTDRTWDGRWTLTGPHAPDLTVGALGVDVAQTDWRATGLPRASLMASPAVRRGGDLIAAPLAGRAAGWTAKPRAPFLASLILR
ncbi:tRNA lysidine(34) synthetase TilS [Jannaschia sp. KMU-145]|uniref:tRNA lysidine(34) synthetase TilS n=1 Tax=Jannaschia halovivens TaxID=3388667 RepID=UPI00396B0FBB